MLYLCTHVLLLLFISVSSQSQDIDADTDLPESDDSVSSSEETSDNHGRISDLPRESEVGGISTNATVTPTTDDTTKCTSQCCLNYNEAFQPVNKLYEALCLQKVEIFTTMV